MNNRNNKVLLLVQFSILLAVEAIVCFTPLGSLPLFGLIVMTLSHVPVVITAILLGTGAGAAMGFAFGLFSFVVWTLMPPTPLTAFVFTPFYALGEFQGNFWSLVICFVPRVLIGVVTGVLHELFERNKAGKVLSYGLSAVLGGLTNTFLVLGGIYVFFGRDYAAAAGTSHDLLLGIIAATVLTNGVPEAVLGGLASLAVCAPLKRRL